MPYTIRSYPARDGRMRFVLKNISTNTSEDPMCIKAIRQELEATEWLSPDRYNVTANGQTVTVTLKGVGCSRQLIRHVKQFLLHPRCGALDNFKTFGRVDEPGLIHVWRSRYQRPKKKTSINLSIHFWRFNQRH